MVELGKENEDNIPELWSSCRLRGMGMSLPSWMYDGGRWGPIDFLENPLASWAVTFPGEERWHGGGVEAGHMGRMSGDRDSDGDTADEEDVDA